MHKRRRFDCGDNQNRVEIRLVLQPNGEGKVPTGEADRQVGCEGGGSV